ncbi:MAG: 3-oxoacyl-[acyl-carrier-protein] synthase III C-terminal domain-containing protein [Spirochaetota bacterium]|nr:3-oxoacyl-[acyl-carrier-protein] synthase III C-terminal domain-containing protein [Spirochaetota bacterium]
MIGIKGYGVSIPYYRMDRGDIHKTWLTMPFPMRGERTVANFDEDSLSLAVEAGIDCLAEFNRKEVDGIYCASTTFPYKEKLVSAIAGTALDLKSTIRAVDFANSLRCGTIAINAALDSIAAGSARNILVTASDCRLGAPGGDLEQSIGDSGAAVLLGADDIIAEVKERYTVTDEFCGMWRSHEDSFVRMWEDRMVHDEGYSKIMPNVISEFLKKCGLTIEDLDCVVCDAPADIRRHAKLAKELKISKEQLQTTYFDSVGNTGSALSIMMLAAALDKAKPGDKILFASYSSGVDVFLLQVTDAIKKIKNRGTFERQLNIKKMIYNYSTYLKWRNIVSMEEAKRPSLPATSISNLHRNAKILLGLYGVKCRKCGTIQYTQAGLLSSYVMPERICIECGVKDDFDAYCFAAKKGTIFSYTQDNLTSSLDPPLTSAIVDFEGGGRGAFEVTDRSPEEIEVGMQVKMTFRHLFYDRGIHNYYWKVRPVR